MECKTARLLIELERPWAPELEPADTSDLRLHLADCADCLSLQQAEQRCDNAIGQAIRAVAAPDGLRERLLSRLQRRPWHQRPMVRWGLSAAAVLLVALGYTLWQRPAPVDVAGLADQVNAWPREAEHIDEWFRKQGIAARVPRGRNFDYGLLTYCGQASLEGKQVPRVDLTSRDGWVAHIYILDPTLFEVDSLNGLPFGSGRFTVQGFPATATERFGYVIFYSGGSLHPFQRFDGPPPA